MRTLAIATATALALLYPASQAGAEVQLTIQDGRVVRLVAKDATVREILAEWGRVGQTKIINAERIPGGPVTLELTDMPERQALDVLLRTISGYVAATRETAVARASMFDRIIVMPTTVAAPTAAGTPPPTFAQPTFGQPAFAQPPQVPEDADDDRPTQPGPGPQNRPPVFVFPPQTPNPQQIPPIAAPAGAFNPPAQAVPAPAFTPPPATLPPTAPYPGAPTSTVVPGGVAVPGMVAQPPTPAPGQQPGFVVPPPQPQQQPQR